MIKKTTVGVLGGALLVSALVGTTVHANSTLLSTLGSVSPTPQSVGILAFGPENILFVGDTKGAAVFALDVADMDHGTGNPVELDGVDRKIASMLGIGAFASHSQVGLTNPRHVRPDLSLLIKNLLHSCDDGITYRIIAWNGHTHTEMPMADFVDYVC